MKALVRLSIAVSIVVLGYFIFLLFVADNDEVTQKKHQITFNFIHNVGEETMVLDTIRYYNAFGNNYSVATLKYFISDIKLHKADGEILLIDEVHYIDANNQSTLSFTPKNKVPDGNYSQVSFIFGLD